MFSSHTHEAKRVFAKRHGGSNSVVVVVALQMAELFDMHRKSLGQAKRRELMQEMGRTMLQLAQTSQRTFEEVIG